MSVELKGVEELALRFEKYAQVDITDGLRHACLLVEGDAREKAPKGKTGELKRSIESEVRSVGSGMAEGVVYANKDYAPYVEYGTGLFAEGGNGRKDVPWHYKDEKGDWHSSSGQPPHPFMRPALIQNKQKILKLLKEECIDD